MPDAKSYPVRNDANTTVKWHSSLIGDVCGAVRDRKFWGWLAVAVAVCLALAYDPAWPTQSRLPRLFITGFAYLSLCAFLWRGIAGRVVSSMLLLAWTLNWTTTLLYKIEYNTRFDIGMALNVIETNSTEAGGQVSQHWQWGVVFLLLFLALLFLTAKISRCFPRRLTGAFVLGGGLFVMLLAVISCAYEMRRHKEHRDDITVCVGGYMLFNTPLYNVAAFLHAREYVRHARLDENAFELTPPDIEVSVSATDVDDYIIVIGESARRRALSLYGATRETAPEEVARRGNMLLFANAISPAIETRLAVSRTLCNMERDAGEHALPRLIGDNIITLAKAAGYKTFWISLQGEGGQ
ncbi:MAG: phosphoethanolamine transferase domain-containing protein [Opitutaceae bacterium]|nr:phosphoethanolamine transferase domain-containing protein [Opitutaceae bacterium]